MNYENLDLRAAALVAYSAMGYVIVGNAQNKSQVFLIKDITVRENKQNVKVQNNVELNLDKRFNEKEMLQNLAVNVEQFIRENYDLARIYGAAILKQFDKVVDPRYEAKLQENTIEAVRTLCNTIEKSKNFSEIDFKGIATNTLNINKYYIEENFKNNSAAKFYKDIASEYFNNEGYINPDYVHPAKNMLDLEDKIRQDKLADRNASVRNIPDPIDFSRDRN